MTRNEMVLLIRVVTNAYPNFNPKDLSDTVDVWYEMLSDYTYEQVATALKMYIRADTSGFAPTIGQIVGKINQLGNPQQMNEAEAWSLVSKAIRNSGYHAEEEFAKLPPTIQKVVGHPSNLRDKALDGEYNDGVEKSNFLRMYRAQVEKDKELNSLPENTRSLLEGEALYKPSQMITDNKNQSISDEQSPMSEAVKEKWDIIMQKLGQREEVRA
jgi:hypothetical protein